MICSGITSTPLISPHSLHTASQLKEELERQGIKPKGTVKANYIDQLLAHDPAYADKIFDVQARNHLLARFRDTKQPWATRQQGHLPGGAAVPRGLSGLHKSSTPFR